MNRSPARNSGAYWKPCRQKFRNAPAKVLRYDNPIQGIPPCASKRWAISGPSVSGCIIGRSRSSVMMNTSGCGLARMTNMSAYWQDGGEFSKAWKNFGEKFQALEEVTDWFSNLWKNKDE
jgi:hypothetical protein